MDKHHLGVHPQDRSWARLGRDPGSGQIWLGPDSARPRQHCEGRKSPSSGQNLLDPGISGRFSTHVFLRGSNEGQNPGLGHGVGKIVPGSTACSTWAKLRGSHQNLPGEISARPPVPRSPPVSPKSSKDPTSPSKSPQVFKFGAISIIHIPTKKSAVRNSVGACQSLYRTLQDRNRTEPRNPSTE